MGLEAVAGCDGHHALTLLYLVWGENPGRLSGAQGVCGTSPMLEYQVKKPVECRHRDIGALDKAFPRPDTAGTIRAILNWSSALSARGRYDI
jgi:hypothetical protein